MKKRGMSLIVLIVTIIVIIILAAVVILTLSKNNPIESAKEASFKEDVRTFQDELTMYIAKEYTNNGGLRINKITATTYTTDGSLSSIYTYIPDFNKKYEGKFVIKNDEIKYNEEKLTEKEIEWCKSLELNANIKAGAEIVAEDPAKYYGESVTNYTANGVRDWEIFYSDGSNVYLIASNYLDLNKLPLKDGAKPTNTNSSYPKSATFTNIINKYCGTADITEKKIKALNSDYFSKGYTSTENNMKSVAYMLDTTIWSSFVNSTYADYAVGGPSVEILFKSYCKKYSKMLYKAQAANATGYQISINGGNSWANYYNNEVLSTSDTLYVFPSTSGANAMWVASPSASDMNAVIGTSSSGIVSSSANTNFKLGFRPLVCLNSNIMLNEVEGGFEIE